MLLSDWYSWLPLIASVLPAATLPALRLTMRRVAGPPRPLPLPSDTVSASYTREPAPSATALSAETPALAPIATPLLPLLRTKLL